jgi:hypothetical protein
MIEKTHEIDERGNYRQIVTAHRLRQILEAYGETTERPAHFNWRDQWDVEED